MSSPHLNMSTTPITEFLSANLWSRISIDADASANRMAAVAYVTSASQVPFRNGDTLVVDASDKAVTTGQTSAPLLQDLFSRGVRLYSLNSLHAKVYAFDSVVIVGSCNLSHSSRTRLLEAAIRTNDQNTVLSARQFVQGLQQIADHVDQPFLTRICQLRVDPSEPVEDENSPRPASSLWRLETPPRGARSAYMRAYFVALIKAQLGELQEGRPFYLWKGHFGHENRMAKFGDQYVLLAKGVTDFSHGDGAPRADLLAAFLSAVTTGDTDCLPPDLADRTLVPLL